MTSPDSVDRLELSAVRELASGCIACDLAQRRTHVVFGEGNATSPLMLVGEGPGETEDRTGRPFVGRAGQLLDRALADAGLSRDQVFITNTVKCRACDWNGTRAVNRPPSEREVAACRPWLLQQLQIIQPRVILCIGAPSAKNLIKPQFRITLERGKFFRSPHARAILATLHPAYILRQSSSTQDGGYSLLVADLAKAWDAAQRLALRPDLQPVLTREPAPDPS